MAKSVPAPPKDRIKGSKTNKPGSATAKKAKSIKFSKKTETALKNKMQKHNEKAPAGRRATMRQLKAVYRRGAGAYSSSHRPGKTRDQWAMARVNAYLKLLKSGKPSNKNYVQDNDLLPSGHPRSGKKDAAAYDALLASANSVEILIEKEYESPEDAIFAFAEYSGLGYETIPAFRAAWLRGQKNGDRGYNRAKDLATLLYESIDSDLLPTRADEAEL
jgi:hypothetical protein